MIVQDIVDSIKADLNYITNSLVVKSYNDEGLVYKWLVFDSFGNGSRREKFIATQAGETLEQRTVILSVDVTPAQ